MSIKIRQIKTVFYRGKEVVHTNRAVHANSAVLNCVNHLQFNRYEATTAEVFDEMSGELHAVFRRPVNGEQIVIVFKREFKGEYNV